MSTLPSAKSRPSFSNMLGRFLVYGVALLAAWCIFGGLIGLAFRVALWVVP